MNLLTQVRKLNYDWYGIYEKKYTCPTCSSTSSVIRAGYRKKIIRLFCKGCSTYFSFNPCFVNRKKLLLDHLNGLSIRTLASSYGLSKSRVSDSVQEQLEELPNNNQFTFNYCNRYSPVFVFDGKYIHVKGYAKKIPLLWGVDYFHHDIPFFILAPSESYMSWATYCRYYRIMNHYPQLIVCDDNTSLKIAIRNTFPTVKVQMCTNHFSESIRRDLRVRTDSTYKQLSMNIDRIIGEKQPKELFLKKLHTLYLRYRDDEVAVRTLLQVQRNSEELLAYHHIPGAPTTNNLMECFNSHLESRLRSIKGFNSFNHAQLWLNGYILKRRYTPFSSCTGQFKKLNGRRPIDISQKRGIVLPILF